MVDVLIFKAYTKAIAKSHIKLAEQTAMVINY